MKIKPAEICFLCFFAVPLFCRITSDAQNTSILNVTPNELSETRIHNPAFTNNPKGESFCWNAAYGMDEFINNFRFTRNTEWLGAGVKYYDFLISKMDTDPDGYKGWIGPYQYDEKYWQDALVGDAIVMAGILDFCVLVLESDTLKKVYGDKANLYVKTAEKDFIQKWDKRGIWHEDGPYGSYTEYNKYLDPADLTKWIKVNTERAGISHPFNKQMDAAEVCLRLYRVTGNKFYRDRAERIFFTAKSHFQYFDNHYCWNYFEPLIPEDVDLKKKDTRHGVWVHPWRSGYQASEVEKIIEAYHYGIVFDEQDIKRIINTNLQVMWNKDTVNPKFISSNGLGADNDTAGIAGFQAAYGHSTVTKNAGELWTGLLDFNQAIRDLYELRFKDGNNAVERVIYENTVLKNPPGFNRKYAKNLVTVPAVNFTESKELYLATVLPHIIRKDKQSIIICKSWIPGDLQIDLYSTPGKKICNLYKGNIGEGTFMITWDGRDPAKKNLFKGDYKIRWTIGTGYREFPVLIQ